MRKVLVLSPHFPPTDAVDMHRVRTTVGHYRQHGWEPVVLSVRPQDAGRGMEPGLVQTVPEQVRRLAVGALPARIGALQGPSAIGLRAWPTLNAAGRKLLREERFDLVFISTTAFPVMTLGRVWKQAFGVPFILDFQDPWATYPPSATPFLRRGSRHRLMRALHRRMEGWTAPEADGLMAVSPAQLNLLQAAYPALQSRPALCAPFGYAEADFAVAARCGRAPWPVRDQQTSYYFAGRIAPAMETSVAAFLAAVRTGRERRPDQFEGLKLRFVGTGYEAQGNPAVVTRLAARAGVADLVEERPDRVSLLDALKGMMEADALLVFGSDDQGYIPSKLSQCLALPKPVICAAPPGSPLLEAVRGMDGVLPLVVGGPGESHFADDLARGLTRRGEQGYPRRLAQARRYEAAACARRECELFDEVAAGWRAAQRAAGGLRAE